MKSSPNRWLSASPVESIWVGQKDALGKEEHLVKSLPPVPSSNPAVETLFVLQTITLHLVDKKSAR